MKKKILRVTTVASTMNVILKGQLFALSEHFEIVGATSRFENYFDEISKREGIKMYPILITRKVNPFLDIISIYQLCKVIFKEKPDIIHSQTPKAGLISMISGFIMRVPIRIHSVVGAPIYSRSTLKGMFLEFIDRIIYAFATKVYANSYGLFEYLRIFKLLKVNKLGIVAKGSSNGIDLNWFNPNALDLEIVQKTKKELNIDKDVFVFGFVGRIVNDKGIRELIDAFQILLKDETLDLKLRLLIVGPYRKTDDPIGSYYLDLINHNPNINYVGLQKDIRYFLQSMDCFVFPSYREGMPGSLLQAFAFGLPCIGTNIIGCKELLEYERGIIIPSKDSTALSLAMKQMIVDSDLRLKVAKNCKEHVELNFDQKDFWNSLINEYQMLLSNN